MRYFTEVQKVVRFIEEQIHEEEIDFSGLEEIVGFSEAHIREIFRESMGMPLVRYIQKRKIMNSIFDLMYSNQSVLEIALDYGFKNHETYTRTFDRFLHLQPKQVRKDRIGIGRLELIQGVYGINLLSESRERSSMEMKERYQDNESTILYGVQKIGYGEGGNTPYPLCLKACANYLGEDVDYSYVMVLTGAAFRMTWNRTCWDLSNVDIYHTMKESNEIYGLGAHALGRSFEFLERKENTTKEEFFQFIKEHIDQGYPCIALGIVGPPEAGIITGYRENGKQLLGYSFFQDDPYFGGQVKKTENGYYITDGWWENPETQVVMCMGGIMSDKFQNKTFLENAIQILTGRKEKDYDKGILAYESWARMIGDDAEFTMPAESEELADKLMTQDDAICCLMDGRSCASNYFRWLSEHEKTNQNEYAQIAKAFDETFQAAQEMSNLTGGWGRSVERSKKFADPEIRKELCRLIQNAKTSDQRALEALRALV